MADVDAGESLAYEISEDRYVWLQVVPGVIELDGGELREGDGVGLVEEPGVAIEATTDAELILFDLA